MAIPTLERSGDEQPTEIRTGGQLDQLLDQIAATSEPDFPIAAILRAHGYEAHILLGLPESFVYLDEVAQRRYFITVGDSKAEGVVSFYLLGQHHTEFERRHLIPVSKARRVLREFFNTGCRSASVEWEESSY